MLSTLPEVALVFRMKSKVLVKISCLNSLLVILFLVANMLQTTHIDKILGRFSMVNNRLLVILEETSGKDTFLNNDKIRNFVTTSKIA